MERKGESRMKRSIVMLGLAALAFALFPSSGRSQDPVNPFLSAKPDAPDVPQQQPPSSLDSYEFNGYMIVGGVVKACVTDKSKGKTFWLELDGPLVRDIQLRRFDPKSGRITLGYGKESKTLEMKKPEIVSVRVAVPAPPVAGPPPSGPPGPPGSRAVSNRENESDEEVRERMKRMAEEIRRRRAMRRQLVEERNAGNAN